MTAPQDAAATSGRVMEEVLAKEEEHADDLKNLIETVAEAEKQASSGERDTSLRKASREN